MNLINNHENQILVKSGLAANIKSNNIEKIKAFLALAESVSIPKALHYRAAMHLAGALNQAETIHESFKYYNEARNYTNKPGTPLKAAVQCLVQFFESNETVFSKNDLQEFLLVVEPLMTFLQVYLSEDNSITEKLILLKRKINYRQTHTAPDAKETKMTFRVLQIKSAFYTDMTHEEMRNELARLVALMVLTKEKTAGSKDNLKDKKPSKRSPSEKKKKNKE